MFSEYYFYVTAFIEDEEVKADFDVLNDSYPTIYRIDRIREYKVLDDKFRIPYANRFEEGEFRKRIQFMYGGKLQRVRFTYSGSSIEAVLDRLPTAVIESENEGVCLEFLRKHADFTECETEPKLNHLKMKVGVSFLPDLSFGAGFYFCKFKKSE